MSNEKPFQENSPAVQAHLGIAQSVIQRMATNSASCKAWCITLVSAILVLVADKGKPTYAYLALIPTILFLVLDSYYLTLEKMFRLSYNNFIDKLHKGNVDASDLYAIVPSGSMIKTFVLSIVSFSIWPFYGTLLFMVYLVKRLVM